MLAKNKTESDHLRSSITSSNENSPLTRLQLKDSVWLVSGR